MVKIILCSLSSKEVKATNYGIRRQQLVSGESNQPHENSDAFVTVLIPSPIVGVVAAIVWPVF